MCGKCASVAVCNSSWTQKHVRALWGGNPPVVFPPCDVDALLTAPTARPKSESKYVLSVGQFRPEKDHAMQLRAWAAMKRHVAGADGKKSFSEGEEAREPPEKKKGKKEEKKKRSGVKRVVARRRRVSRRRGR